MWVKLIYHLVQFPHFELNFVRIIPIVICSLSLFCKVFLSFDLFPSNKSIQYLFLDFFYFKNFSVKIDAYNSNKDIQSLPGVTGSTNLSYSPFSAILNLNGPSSKYITSRSETRSANTQGKNLRLDEEAKCVKTTKVDTHVLSLTSNLCGMGAEQRTSQ